MATEPLARTYIRALTPKRVPRVVPGSWTAPSRSRGLVRVDAEHLRRYRQLCGFPSDRVLPQTYPHLTAFPMGMELLTRKDFPYPVLGLVHIRNEIAQLRPIEETETLDYHVWVDKPYAHEKGVAFDVRAEVSDAVGNLVWRSSSTYLRRAGGGSKAAGSSGSSVSSQDAAAASAAASVDAAPPPSTSLPSSHVWQLPADLGRRYAALTGDRNPIHLYPWSAKLFGFRRQIAHGMWSAARCLSALQPPDAPATFTVEFRAPVLLPATVALAAAHEEREGLGISTAFSLTSVVTARTHLTGRLVLV